MIIIERRLQSRARIFVVYSSARADVAACALACVRLFCLREVRLEWHFRARAGFFSRASTTKSVKQFGLQSSSARLSPIRRPPMYKKANPSNSVSSAIVQQRRAKFTSSLEA